MRLGASSIALCALLAACSQGSDDSSAAQAGADTTNAGSSGTSGGATTEEDAPLPAEWPNHGSAACQNHTNADPTIYKFQLNSDTVILRENKCFNFEANFIYLLFGHDKVLMMDTGSVPQGFTKSMFTAGFPIHDFVEGVITDWLHAHPNPDGSIRTRDTMQLIVSHTHSHGDHVSGDYQFKDASGHALPNTQVVGLRPTDVATFFGLQNWPNQSNAYDLGGRIVEILPIPGHESSHIAYYDHRTQNLFTGDTLYPGHIFIENWAQFRASTTRLANWITEKDASGNLLRPVKQALGCHIEKMPTTGEASFYPYPSWIQDPERKLELSTDHVAFEAQQAQTLGPNVPSDEQFFDDFSIDP
jgi:glyoxylase-like metal-dependent hydrolase (beta-lactamase superfamily II)